MAPHNMVHYRISVCGAIAIMGPDGYDEYMILP